MISRLVGFLVDSVEWAKVGVEAAKLVVMVIGAVLSFFVIDRVYLDASRSRQHLDELNAVRALIDNRFQEHLNNLDVTGDLWVIMSEIQPRLHVADQGSTYDPLQRQLVLLYSVSNLGKHPVYVHAPTVTLTTIESELAGGSRSAWVAGEDYEFSGGALQNVAPGEMGVDAELRVHFSRPPSGTLLIECSFETETQRQMTDVATEFTKGMLPEGVLQDLASLSYTIQYPPWNTSEASQD